MKRTWIWFCAILTLLFGSMFAVLIPVTPSSATTTAVASISPSYGSAVGGTVVTITGTGFSTTAGATTVDFGSTLATGVSCSTTTSCVATAPSYAGTTLPATIDITVNVGGATSATSAYDQFTYEAPAEVSGTVSVGAGANSSYLAGVCVNAIVVSGSSGTTVTGIPVSYTSGATKASYNLSLDQGTYNLQFYYCGSSSVYPLLAQYYDATASNTSSSTSPSAVSVVFGQTYSGYDVTLPPMPVVASVSPDFGPIGGRNLVTINGIGFTGATEVTFGSIGTVRAHRGLTCEMRSAT